MTYNRKGADLGAIYTAWLPLHQQAGWRGQILPGGRQV